MNIGARLRTLRTRKSMSQQALANLAGLDRLTITKMETNRLTPSLKSLEKICSGLNITLAQFFSGTEANISEDLIPLIEIVSEMDTKQMQQLLDIAKILKQDK